MSDMTVITENDVIESVADALQYISYYHPMDYIRALGEAYEAEKGPGGLLKKFKLEDRCNNIAHNRLDHSRWYRL